MADLHYATTTLRGTNVHFANTGSGPAVVLLHGFLEDSSIWHNLAARLAHQFQVILIDLPGFGRSGGRGYCQTMDDLGLAVLAVIDQLAIDKFHLFGHSMGGYVTLAVAEKCPDRLQSYGLVHSSALPDSPEKQHDRERAISAIKQDLTLFCALTLPNLFAETNRARCVNEIEQLINAASLLKPKNVVAAIRGMMARPDRTNVLAQANVPVLLLQGDNDPVVPMAIIAKHRNLSPNLETHVLPNVGHMGYIESPEAFNTAIIGFLQNVAFSR